MSVGRGGKMPAESSGKAPQAPDSEMSYPMAGGGSGAEGGLDAGGVAGDGDGQGWAPGDGGASETPRGPSAVGRASARFQSGKAAGPRPGLGAQPPAGDRAVAWAQVPATSANLGPGFDSFALALPGWHLQAWLCPSVQDPRRWDRPARRAGWVLRGKGPALHPPESNLVVRAIVAAFERAGHPHPAGWHLSVASTIPPARGLGSSAAAIVAGLSVANRWLCQAGSGLSQDDLFQLAATLEGHADNVAAALWGGAVVTWREEGDLGGEAAAGRPSQGRASGMNRGVAPGAAGGAPASRELAPPQVTRAGDRGGTWRALELALSQRWQAVVAIPAVSGYTRDARNALPAAVPHGDAAFNVARAALLVAALTAGRDDLLREAMQDRLHQPYRMRLFPWLDTLIQRALAAGASGACMSGAGPSVLALVAPQKVPSVVAALREGLREAGLAGRVQVSAVGGPGCRSRLVKRAGEPMAPVVENGPRARPGRGQRDQAHPAEYPAPEHQAVENS